MRLAGPTVRVARPRAQRLSEMLYRAGDACASVLFRNEHCPLPSSLVVNGVEVDTVADVAEFTGLGRDIAEAEISRRRSLSFRAEWFATPPRVRRDHWFYLSSKTYLFANASHFTDGKLVQVASAHIPPGGRVLDFGGGSGELTLQLAAAAYDMSFLELNALQRDFMRFRIARHDLHDLVRVLDPWAPIPTDTFDAIFAMDVIEHLPDAEVVLRDRLLPALTRGGVLIENSPFVAGSANPMHHADFGFEALMVRREMRAVGAVADGTRIWRSYH